MRYFLAAFALAAAAGGACAAPAKGSHVWVLLRNGTSAEYPLVSKTIRLEAEDRQGDLRLTDVLSVHLGASPDADEAARISKALEEVSDKERRTADAASELLVNIGLPAAYAVVAKLDKTDTDLREPQPVYRVFERCMPAGADAADRTLDLVRLANGARVRGRVLLDSLIVLGAAGEQKIDLKSVRAFAVLRDKVEKTVAVHSLRHCSYLDYMDLGIRAQKGSALKVSAEGWARMSFDIDGWSSDPDGLKVPGPNYKTNLYDGFPFGALVAKIGAVNPRFLVGKRYSGSAETDGRLYLAVNDNPHWQNNIGSYKAKVSVENCYDLGEPR